MILLPVSQLIPFTQQVYIQVVGIHNHHNNSGPFINLIADHVWIPGNADADVLIFWDVFSVEAVQSPDLLAEEPVESAVDAPQLVQTGSDRCPEHPAQTAGVDGKLHLHRQAHARSRRSLPDKAGEQLGPEAGAHLVLCHHPSLTQGDHLLAGGKDIPWLIDGLNISFNKVDIAFPRLDEMCGNGMAGIDFPVCLDQYVLSLICVKFHQDTPSKYSSRQTPREWICSASSCPT